MNEKESLSSPERFESDTQKIVRKHLEDKEHIITDEEIRNVRVGMTPAAGTENSGEIMEEEIKNGGTEAIKDNPADDSITPWDTIEH